jgi:Gpi18-like mannosyltransferase
MVALLGRVRGRWSWVCWAGALLVKPQAIVFAPVLYLATLRRYGCQGLVSGGAIAAGLIALGCAPLVLAGQGPGLLQAYAGSVGRFPQLTNRAYNLWYLVTLGASGSDVGSGLGLFSLRLVGMLLMGCAALLVCVALLYRWDAPTRALGAAILALAFFTLPTQIHERYLFLPLAFVMMRAAADRPLIIAYLILMVSATLNILGALRGFSAPAYQVIAASPIPLVLAVINILALVALIGRLLATSVSMPRVGAAVPSGRRPEVS